MDAKLKTAKLEAPQTLPGLMNRFRRFAAEQVWRRHDQHMQEVLRGAATAFAGYLGSGLHRMRRGTT